MSNLLTTSDMKLLEDLSEKYGVSKSQLMETAGLRIAQVVDKRAGLEGKNVLVVSYHGNNGGDGFAAARYMSHAKNCRVDVLFIGEEKKLKKEAKANYEKLKKEKVNILRNQDKVDFKKYNIIVDALLGTGIKGSIKGKMASVIKKINASSAYKASVDIPTGVNPDTGEIGEIAVIPDTVITFHNLKKGLARYPKERIIVNIGIPEEAEDEFRQKHNR